MSYFEFQFHLLLFLCALSKAPNHTTQPRFQLCLHRVLEMLPEKQVCLEGPWELWKAIGWEG